MYQIVVHGTSNMVRCGILVALLLAASIQFSGCIGEEETDEDGGVKMFQTSNTTAIRPLWDVSIGGSQEEAHGHFILACGDGGFLQIGETGFIPDSALMMVVKIDSEGSLQWMQEFGVKGHNLGNSAIEVSDGYVVVGAINQNGAVMKLDKISGTVLFNQVQDAGGSDAIESIVEVPGGFMAVGYSNAEDTENTFFTEGQGMAWMLNETGVITSEMSLNQHMSHAYRIAMYQNELLVSGLTEEAMDYSLLKLTLAGDVVWNQVYGGEDADHNFAFDVASDGTMFLSGHTQSGTENWDTYTIKVDNDGVLLWEATVGNPRGFDPAYIHDEAWGARATEDGGVVVVAGTGDEYDEYSKCSSGECSDAWRAYLIKFSENGSVEWEFTYSGEGGDWAGEDVCLTDDGGLVVAVDDGGFGFLRLALNSSSES